MVEEPDVPDAPPLSESLLLELELELEQPPPGAGAGQRDDGDTEDGYGTNMSNFHFNPR